MELKLDKVIMHKITKELFIIHEINEDYIIIKSLSTGHNKVKTFDNLEFEFTETVSESLFSELKKQWDSIYEQFENLKNENKKNKKQLTFDFSFSDDYFKNDESGCKEDEACSSSHCYSPESDESDESASDDKIYITWDMIDSSMEKLVIEKPDLIICITRGGLIPAGLISYKLNTKNIINIEVGSYVKEVQGELIIKKLPEYYLDQIAHAKKILIVDDIIDSGNTIKEVINYICASNTHYSIGAIETLNRIEVFSILTKIDNLPVPQSSLIYSDSEQWVVFPWDK